MNHELESPRLFVGEYVKNIPDWYFERTVFPGERLLFEAQPEAELEVWMSTERSAIVCDRILCDRLQVEEASTVD
ncbi:DUF1830 domain-containing protein [Tychonema sp. BBK16]|uniref:DUF1830 domain-containing protein n=1 Tax=Tychonema sp. BBK16 TaxID=2699888 RepID=UPI001F1609B1|nr:DUF1830 domain-containing protein [Tychonema sp. BBK16]